jgi:hypothetical protein
MSPGSWSHTTPMAIADALAMTRTDVRAVAGWPSSGSVCVNSSMSSAVAHIGSSRTPSTWRSPAIPPARMRGGSCANAEEVSAIPATSARIAPRITSR